MIRKPPTSSLQPIIGLRYSQSCQVFQTKKRPLVAFVSIIQDEVGISEARPAPGMADSTDPSFIRPSHNGGRSTT